MVIYFNDALEEWLHVVQLRVKESTFAKYTYIAENHLIQKIGREKISQINAARINQFLLEKAERGVWMEQEACLSAICRRSAL